MRKAVIAAAVTTGVVAAAARPKKPAKPRATKVVVPAQRTGLALIVEDVDGLAVDEQDAQDARLLDALVGRAS